ncbi:MAG: cyclopropane-fatty-acyl-phospholipid synthase [Hyphomicrobiales bacterium]|jgi:cyclopropane-fatty-acyl-phospholipid synthase|nr:cyclopropane-fatty-acyl-phospholipid synthase [Hyphomicrobiales bacterium]|tara:strand:+ start:2290 stop:3444 length:1155 start_codon:yes stop_codon:yes gene_type:complete
MKKYILKLFDWRPEGSINLIFPDKSHYLIGSEATPLEIKFNNYKIVRNYFLSGPNAFGDCFINGDIECNNLTDFFIFYIRNKKNFDRMLPFKIFNLNISYLSHILRQNTLRGSKRNIRVHYDMGNDFFETWLDDTMQYSSAHFEKKHKTLEEAQENKFKKLNDYLYLNDNEKLLEIGCGWGTLSQYLFNINEIDLDAITISKEQLIFAKNLELKESNNKCNFVLKDYRNITETYNKIISIEMIEAVGKKYLPLYLKKIKECLKDDGHAIIQGITIANEKYDEYSKQVDFIQKYIFPGGFLPSKDLLINEAHDAGLKVEIIEDLNPSYVETLALWREKFNNKWPSLKNMGYDEKFKRIWNYYLSYCEAGFSEETIFISIFKLTPR